MTWTTDDCAAMQYATSLFSGTHSMFPSPVSLLEAGDTVLLFNVGRALGQEYAAARAAGGVYGNDGYPDADEVPAFSTTLSALGAAFVEGFTGALREPVPKLSVIDGPDHRRLNLEAAKSSFRILKGKFPVPLTDMHTIGVIGPGADSREVLRTDRGRLPRMITVLQGIQDLCSGQRILFSEGCHILNSDRRLKPGNRDAEAKSVCEYSDLVILCLGKNYYMDEKDGEDSFPGSALPEVQQKLMRLCVESGKPLVLILFSETRMDLCGMEEAFSAILQVGHPGAFGGRAAAETIFKPFIDN